MKTMKVKLQKKDYKRFRKAARALGVTPKELAVDAILVWLRLDAEESR